MEKTIFITGASTGLGKATAKLFATNGWNVIATMRKPEKETELNLIDNITLLPLDITSLAQIEETSKKAMTLGNIDVLFNNAAYGLMGTLEYLTDEQIFNQVNTNLLGVFRVTKAFIPYFKEKKNGLIITTTSISAFTPNPLSGIYNATKWALEGWSESTSYDLAQFNIGIKTVAPGGIKSNFSNSMQVAMGEEYQPLMDKTMSVWFNNGAEFSEPATIAKTVYEAATDGKDQMRYIAGTDAKKMFDKKQKEGSESFRIGMTNTLLSNS